MISHIKKIIHAYRLGKMQKRVEIHIAEPLNALACSANVNKKRRYTMYIPSASFDELSYILSFQLNFWMKRQYLGMQECLIGCMIAIEMLYAVLEAH